MGILVIGAVFVDIKGFPSDAYIPTGRNAGTIEYVHGGVARNAQRNHTPFTQSRCSLNHPDSL